MEEFENKFSEIASLLGDKSRSIMLWCLLDGRAYTAMELSICADISAQSTSNHLKKLIKANVLSVEKQGRHRYYRYASADVAQVIESMAGLVSLDENYKRVNKPSQNNITYARTCYDHLAGEIGVRITDALLDNGIVEVLEKKYVVTTEGKNWFKEIGINVDEIMLQKRSFAHPCLDWSERRYHIAGALGASFLTSMLQNDWIRKKKDSREVIVTSIGKVELRKRLHLEI
ncbi:helix-turn-helix transcriptional regulator [Aquimarina sp. I32.4]|uniref:ArsR/SmtB family transcription factor n=1 Tax=Aquimarina sp. I32.4 TaxID=2053903 RepID=UPI000CDE72E9|nr:helix-turn-helix domain-containing protein [Aquimarina sp. I32.4]